jgi:hypothetical protein
MADHTVDDGEFAQVTHNFFIWPALALLGLLAASVASTVFSIFWL